MQLDLPLDRVLETGTHVRVLRALAGLPGGFAASCREIARRAGTSHTTASRILRGLEDLRLVDLQRAGRADLYRLNEAHILVPQIRALFEQEGGIRSQLIAYLRAELPMRIGRAEGAFLFGSAGGGDTHPDSDIDVGVVAPVRPTEEIEPAIATLSAAVRERFGSELNVLVTRSGRDRKRRPKVWDRIEAEGVPLLEMRHRRGGPSSRRAATT